jgi:nicotinate-nucleotide adenylyltransferase
MIGVLGGTFDPIHFGHLRTALDVTETLDLQQLRFIPCGEPPHRQPPVASAAQRLAMVQAAIAGEARFVADDREIRRGGPSYMVETLGSLRDELGAQQALALIVGLDAFAALHDWHRWQELIGLAHLIVMTRPGWSMEDISNPDLQALVSEHRTDDHASCHNQVAGCVIFCPVTELAISSTRIRQQLQIGKNVRFLLPEAVQELIQQQHIYS